MTPKRWFHHGNRWAHPIVYVRTAHDAAGRAYAQPYTRYTLVVEKQPHGYNPYAYAWRVHDGSVLDPVLASGESWFLFMAQFRAGWAVPS